MVAILYNKTNAFYLIAGSLAALTSGVLITVFNAPPFLTIILATLFTLAVVFFCRIISDRAKINGLVKENKDLAGVKQQLESERAKLVDAEKKIQELKDKIKHHVQLSKDLADVKRKLDSKRRKIQELVDIVNHKETELIDAKKKIQDLGKVVQDQGTEITNLTEKMQGQKIDAKKKIQELEDIVKHKETELIDLLEKVKKESTTSQDLQNEVNALTGEKMLKNNEHKVEDEQRSRAQSLSMSEGVKKQETQRRNSFPFSSLSLLGSKKVSSSTHSLPQQ